MIYNDKYSLLFIEPSGYPSLKPLIDKYTLKVLYQLKNFTSVGVTVYNSFRPNVTTLGVHECTGKNCNVRSSSFDLLLPCGLSTNTLALHYISYHRDEVSAKELEKIDLLCEFYEDDLSSYDIDKYEYIDRAYDFLEKNRFKSVAPILPFDFDKDLFLSNKYTVPRLREILEYMDIDSKGKKSVLIDRLKKHINV